MDSLLLKFFGLLSVALLKCCSAGVIPSPVAVAPLEYAKAVPYNVPPHVSRIDVSSKIISSPWLTAGSLFAAAAPFPAVTPPVVASPVIAAPVYPAPVTAAYPAPVTAPILPPTILEPPYTSPFAYPTFPAYDPAIFG